MFFSSFRIMVFNAKGDSGQSDMILINPKIVRKSEETDRLEVCLVANNMLLSEIIISNHY